MDGAGVVGVLDDLLGDVVGEEGPDLVAERLDGRVEAEVEATLGGVRVQPLRLGERAVSGGVGLAGVRRTVGGGRDRSGGRVIPEPAGQADQLAAGIAQPCASLGIDPAMAR